MYDSSLALRHWLTRQPQSIQIERIVGHRSAATVDELVTFLRADTSGFISPRPARTIANAMESGDVWVARDGETLEIVASASIFAASAYREFGGTRSIVRGWRLQETLLRLRLRRELERVGHAGSVFAVVARQNMHSVRTLMGCGFREKLADDAFFAATGARRETFAGQRVLLAISDAAAWRAVKPVDCEGDRILLPAPRTALTPQLSG